MINGFCICVHGGLGCGWGMAGSLTVYSGKSDKSLAEIQVRSLVVDQIGDGALLVG